VATVEVHQVGLWYEDLAVKNDIISNHSSRMQADCLIGKP
jgi:hypothetical protein